MHSKRAPIGATIKSFQSAGEEESKNGIII